MTTSFLIEKDTAPSLRVFILPSMIQVGSAFADAMAEICFATLKTQPVHCRS
ncbi:hypothetical protein RCG71_11040 [Kocuria sp. CPCC 205281]